jgi:dihydrofolate reductase
VYIIGGASLYTNLLDKADRLCLTEIDDTPEKADTFFPEYAADWQEEWREDHPVDDRHPYPYAFVDYVRK